MVSPPAGVPPVAVCGAVAGLGVWLLLAGGAGRVVLPAWRPHATWRDPKIRLLVVCVLAGVVVAALTRIPVMGLLVAALAWIALGALTGPSVPVLVATGDAVASWTETIRQELEAGQPLRAAVVAACDNPPAILAEPLARLADRLTAVALPEALWALRGEVDHPALGPVVAALDVAYRRGAGDLPKLMASQVETTRHRVAVLRDTHAARAKHRRAMSLLLGLFGASILTLLAVWPTFLSTYRPVSGQLVLAGIGLAVLGAVRALIRLSQPAPAPDFFARPPLVDGATVPAGDGGSL